MLARCCHVEAVGTDTKLVCVGTVAVWWCRRLQGRCATLADDRFGCWVIEKAFTAADLTRKVRRSPLRQA